MTSTRRASVTRKASSTREASSRRKAGSTRSSGLRPSTSQSSLSRSLSRGRSNGPSTSDTDLSPRRQTCCLTRVPFAPRRVATDGRLLTGNLCRTKVVFGSQLSGLTLDRGVLLQLISGCPSFGRLSRTCCRLCLLCSQGGRARVTGDCISGLGGSCPRDRFATLLSSPCCLRGTEVKMRVRSSVCALACRTFGRNGCRIIVRGSRVSSGQFPANTGHSGCLFVDNVALLGRNGISRYLRGVGRIVTRCPGDQLDRVTKVVMGNIGTKEQLCNKGFSLDGI